MTASPRFIGPQPLSAYGPTLRAQLERLRHADGRFVDLLRELPPCLAIVALDTRGVCGWATCEPSGLLGVYVHPRCRRKGIGTELAERARRTLEAVWPGVEWEARANPGTVGRAFWRMRARWARRAA